MIIDPALEMLELANCSVAIQEQLTFACSFRLFARNFKGHSSAPTVGQLNVSCNSLGEFKDLIWQKVSSYIKREVIWNTDAEVAKPQWSQAELSCSDLGRFVIFFNKTQKRAVDFDDVTVAVLQSWRDKDIHLYIHVYSTSVSNNATFKIVKTMLLNPEERDRAGAASTETLRRLAAQLREHHQFNYVSADINWMVWANYIQSAEPHYHEEMIRSAPPADVIHLFAHARTDAEQELAVQSHSVRTAESINTTYKNKIAVIRQTFDKFKLIAADLENRITELEEIANAQESLLSSMASSSRPTQSDHTRSLRRRISDLSDVDHQP